MTALAKIPEPSPLAPELTRARAHASAVVNALEVLERAAGDPHVTALLIGARQLLGAVEVEIERVGGGPVALARPVGLPTTEIDRAECARLAATCERLALLTVRHGGPGASAVRFSSRRLVVATEEFLQQDRRLAAEVRRTARPPRAAIASLSTAPKETDE